MSVSVSDHGIGPYLKFFQVTFLTFFGAISGIFTHIVLGFSYILCAGLFVRHFPHFYLFPELFVFVQNNY